MPPARSLVRPALVTRAPWVCVLDADLQHPPEVIPELLAAAERGEVDVVVASRYCRYGSAGALGRVRALISVASTAAAKLLFPVRLHGVTDPMSGFFLVRSDAVDLEVLRPRGLKILLELLVRSRGLHLGEVGFAFALRTAGESKGSLGEGLGHLASLLRLRLGQPARPSPMGWPAAERG
jgi:dolichol-phosphate mannosyltransferase